MDTTSTRDTIVEEITINAPAARIFDALANPAERVKWWNVEGRFTTTEMESDLRPGGKWAMRGTAMGGRPFTVAGTYRVVDRPRVLAFTWLPDWQGDSVESLVRIELHEDRGVTRVRLIHSGLSTENSRNSHRGWPAVLGLLGAYVTGHS